MAKFFAKIMIAICLCYSMCCSQPVTQPSGNLEIMLRQLPEYHYQIVAVLPHNTSSFTEGLELNQHVLYESTGLYGHSKLRMLDGNTHQLIRQIVLPGQLFGEGITLMHDKIYQLTWRERTGMVYDKNQMTLLNKFTYNGEGWGLTHDQQHLIMGNGSSHLFFINPNTMQIERTVLVTANQRPVRSLNELEYIHHKIYANVWPTAFIVIISPETGKIEGWLDLRKLKSFIPDMSENVANGIAFDEKNNTLLVTGKNWPKLFVIKLTNPSSALRAPFPTRLRGDLPYRTG